MKINFCPFYFFTYTCNAKVTYRHPRVSTHLTKKQNPMENSEFEKTENERFNAFLFRAVSFAFWFPGMILIQLPLGQPALTVVSIVTALFSLLFVYASIKVHKVFRKIKKDPELQQALTLAYFQNSAGFCRICFHLL